MHMTYTSGRLTSVTDGAGRSFTFTYNDNDFVTAITAPDGSSITYTYIDNYLTEVTYQDGRKAVLSYDASSKPSSIYLQYNGVNVYKVEYQFSGDKLTAVIEYGVEQESETDHPEVYLGAVDSEGNLLAESETFCADFSAHLNEWQYASVRFAKSKYQKIEKLTVYCDYDHNVGTAYFDDIQLVRDSIETELTAEDFIVENTEDGLAEAEEVVNEPDMFEELQDVFGNALTETVYTDGEFGTIYRAFAFNEDDETMNGDNAGNDLIRETDARGNKTEYQVNAVTSKNEEVTDRCGNKTAYESYRRNRSCFLYL